MAANFNIGDRIRYNSEYILTLHKSTRGHASRLRGTIVDMFPAIDGTVVKVGPRARVEWDHNDTFSVLLTNIELTDD